MLFIPRSCLKFTYTFKNQPFKSIPNLQTIMSAKRTLEDEAKSSKKQKTSGHWSQGLLDAMKDPENVVQEDDTVITIKDKYPKARFHYLVMPKEDISSLKSVTSEHKELLKHMEEVGEEIAKQDKHKDSKFNLGYHAEASMFRLHLHVISEDMNSECVKTKKHWNSYTTEFFLSSKEVREQLENEGKIKLPSSDACKKLINLPLKCHKCDFKPKHMPDLKRHFTSHFK